MASTMDSMMHSIPGSYLFQHDHRQGSARSHSIFQPPAQSPTPSHRLSHIPRPTSRSSKPYSSRKRPKLDTNTSYFSRPVRPAASSRSTTSTPLNLGGSYDHVTLNGLDSSTTSFEDQNPGSPSPLANSEYRLAGGLDTPCTSLERGLDELAQDEEEKDYRFNRYTTTDTSVATLSTEGSGTFSEQSQSQEVRVTSSQSRKRTRSPTKSPRSITGWGIRSTAWALTGGLAGRVFNFCINTAFRGFSAGGGESYQMNMSTSMVDKMNSKLSNSNSDIFFGSHLGTPSLLGDHSHDFGGFVEDYMNSPEARRADYNDMAAIDHSYWDSANHDGSFIKNDWQIIDQAGFMEGGDEQSPARKKSRASVAGNWQRPISRNSMNNRSSATGASYASPRARTSSTTSFQLQRSLSNEQFQPVRRSRPSLAPARRSQSYFPASPYAALGQKSPERPSSSASNRRVKQPSDSALSPEVVDYRRKMKAREKVEDENFRRLNAQLRDMIREGKEALGSTVEILDDGISRSHVVAHESYERYLEDGWR